MPRYIDADKLLKNYGLAHAEKYSKSGGRTGYETLMKYEIADMIEDAPTVDVAPVVHGEWHIVEYEYLHCSHCGREYYTGAESTDEAKARLKNEDVPPFCPNCGAKMQGED